MLRARHSMQRAADQQLGELILPQINSPARPVDLRWEPEPGPRDSVGCRPSAIRLYRSYGCISRISSAVRMSMTHEAHPGRGSFSPGSPLAYVTVLQPSSRIVYRRLCVSHTAVYSHHTAPHSSSLCQPAVGCTYGCRSSRIVLAVATRICTAIGHARPNTRGVERRSACPQ
jgi:hypothetical protein